MNKLLYAASEVIPVESWKGKKGNYFKTFLINPKINYNGWQVPQDKIRAKLKDWIGIPILDYVDDSGKHTHPEYDDYETGKKDQERYRVGTIVDVGYDERSGNFWQVAESTSDEFYKGLVAGEVRYVSPSIFPKEYDDKSWPLVVSDYYPMHLAYVDEPAYGRIAGTSGTCSDSAEKCKTELAPLIANAPITPKPLQKSSLILSVNEADHMADDMQKKVDELHAEIDEIKKTVTAMEEDKKTQNANEKNGDGEENKKADNEEHPKKDGMTAEEKQEIKNLKQQNASLMESAKKPIIDKILNASRERGATEEQLRKQAEYLQASTLEQIQNFDIFMSPFILASANAPDLARLGEQLSADTDDNKLLQEAGVY